MKFTKIAALAAVAVMACGGFYGCDDGGSGSTPAGTTSSQAGTSQGGQQQTTVAGTWKIDSITVNGKTQSLNDYVTDMVKSQLGSSVDLNSAEAKQVFDTLKEAFDTQVFEFTEDGKLKIVTSAQGATNTQEGTYTVDGKTVTITLNGQSSPMEFDAAAGTLIQEAQGMKLVMKKK